MTRRTNDIVNDNLIGRKAHIIEATDPRIVCRSGTIIGESKEMLCIRSTESTLNVPKSICTFEITTKDSTVRVAGHLLRGRPEDRLKKRVRGGL
ncbi:MAG: ribonuclease P protein subunit [Candidatus Thorarchaeota archaeon]